MAAREGIQARYVCGLIQRTSDIASFAASMKTIEAKDYRFHNIILDSMSGYFLIYTNRSRRNYIRLANGMTTLAKLFQLSQAPHRLKMVAGSRVPDAFIGQHCNDRMVGILVRGAISLERIRGVKARETASKLLTEAARPLPPVPEERKGIERGQEEEEKEDEYLAKDKKPGFRINFDFYGGKRVTYEVKGKRRCGGYEEEDENSCSIGFREGTGDEPRHLYIYSTRPTEGKSLVVSVVKEHLNACVIDDPSSFRACRHTAQFLVFDDYGRGAKRLPLPVLEALTCGSSVGRADSAVFIFANAHLFEVYANVWDSKRKRRFIDPVLAKDLRARFRVVKLDDEYQTEEEDASNWIWDDRRTDGSNVARKLKCATEVNDELVASWHSL